VASPGIPVAVSALAAYGGYAILNCDTKSQQAAGGIGQKRTAFSYRACADFGGI